MTKKLQKVFEDEFSKVVHVVSEHDLEMEKNDVFASSVKEKSIRGSLKGSVERCISREDVVILDSLNYIKGYRYELHCIIKAHKTLHCVLYTATSQEMCWQWNLTRSQADQYNKEVFDGLVMRFEPPDSRSRWDSPLFTVFPDDDIPFQEIYDSLYTRKALPPNQSTMPTPLSSTNFMYELDRITQEIITSLLDAQKTSFIGDYIKVPNATDKIYLLKNLTLAELRRMKRQFLNYTKMHPIEDVQKIGNMYVQFINSSLK